MKHDDDNALALLMKSISRAWWHRPGHEAIGQLIDTLEALHFENRSGLKPVLAHKHRTETGWHLVWNLPPGISSQDVADKTNHFLEQTGATAIELKPMGAKLHMDVYTAKLPDMVPYAWDPKQYPKMILPVPIGMTPAGMVVADLPQLPHLFVGGATMGGKTTFLRSLVVSLAHMQNCAVMIIDLKGLDFACVGSHALVVDNESDASQALALLNKEMDRRKKLLQAARVEKFQDYPDKSVPWIVCVIDELAELTEEEDQDALNRLARLSRAMGICLVAATQRPSHDLFKRFTTIRGQFPASLVFYMKKPEESKLLLDSDAACHLDPSKKGRAIWKWDREIQVQCPYLSYAQASKIVDGLPAAEEVIFYEQRPARLLPR